MEDKDPRVISEIPGPDEAMDRPVMKGDIAPSPLRTETSRLIGSLAPPLAKHTSPPKPDRLVELNYGTLKQVQESQAQVEVAKGMSAYFELPDEIDLHNNVKKTELRLQIGDVPVEIRPISYEELQRTTTEGGEGWARSFIEKRGGILLIIDGTEIAIEDLAIEDFYDPSSLPLQDLPPEGVDSSLQKLNELKTVLNNHEQSRAIDQLIEELQDRKYTNDQIKEEARAKAELQLKEASLRVAIGRAKVRNPSSGKEEQMLTIVPTGTAALKDKVHLLKPIKGAAHKEKTTIDDRGMHLENITDIDTVSRKHLIIEMKDGKLTFVDGDGEDASSTNGTVVYQVTRS